MIRAAVFALFLAGCGAESQQAFTPRSAAREPAPLPPNKTADHNRSLQDCLDRNTHMQDVLCEPVPMQGDAK